MTSTDRRKVAFTTATGFLALGFGSGLAPRAPGTFGTLAAAPLAWLLIGLPLSLYLVVVLMSFVAGIWICEQASRALGEHDPGCIVWDEMVGFWLAVAFVPVSIGWWLGAFLAFRFFDIVKPWPVRYLDRRFGGGLGIMLDDIAAAGYTIGVLAMTNWLLQSV